MPRRKVVEATKLDFHSWVRGVVKTMEEMGSEGYTGQYDPCCVDAMVPYNMGLNPKQAARAFLGLDSRMRKAITSAFFESGNPINPDREKPEKRKELHQELKKRIVAFLEADPTARMTRGELASGLGILDEAGKQLLHRCLTTLYRQQKILTKHKAPGVRKMLYWAIPESER